MDAPALVHHLLEHSADRRSDKIAVIQDDRRITYGELNRRADGVAAFLIGQKVQQGDRVVLLSENSINYVAGYYGILKAGAVAVPLSSDLKPAGLTALLKEVDPVSVIAAGRFERLLRAVDWNGIQTRFLIIAHPKMKPEQSPLQIYTFDHVAQSTVPSENTVSIEEEDLAAIIYTSGSTGRPKGVMLTHRNIVANTLSICDYLALISDDIQMVVLPFFYVMGKSLLNTHIAVAGTVVINNKFAFPADVLNQMQREKVTGFAGVPSTYAYLLHRSPLRSMRNELPSLRYCTQAGGHMPKKLKEELLTVLPDHTRLVIMYGATEASARLTYVPPDRLGDKIDAIGIPIPGVELMVVDEHGNPAADYQHGELLAGGPNIMRGYWRSPEDTKSALKNGMYRTGDLGYRDEEGFYFVVGRKDGLVKVGGHRINPQEIEDALIETDLLVEAAVLGIDDPLMGKRLVALAVAKEAGLDEKQILEGCTALLPRYKVPSDVKLTRALPKNSNGKIDKEKCLKMVQQEKKIRNPNIETRNKSE